MQDKIQMILECYRSLKEDGAVGYAGNGVNPPGGPIAIAGLPPDDPPVHLKKRKKKKYAYMKGTRKLWQPPKNNGTKGS